MCLFAQCMKRHPGNPDGDNHEKCMRFLNGRYFAECLCPCHHGGHVKENPCQRCNGTGKYGPHTVENARCFRCDGSGVEPSETAKVRK